MVTWWKFKPTDLFHSNTRSVNKFWTGTKWTLPSSLLIALWPWLLTESPSLWCFWLSLTYRAFCIAGRKSGTLMAGLWPIWPPIQSDSLPPWWDSWAMRWAWWSVNSPCHVPSAVQKNKAVSSYSEQASTAKQLKHHKAKLMGCIARLEGISWK